MGRVRLGFADAAEKAEKTGRPSRRQVRKFTSIATTGCAPMGKIPDTAAARKALKVAEIKALLEEAGLATDGTKPTLLERLEEVRSTPERIPNPVPI